MKNGKILATGLGMLVVGAAGLVTGSLGGCQEYATYPPVESSKGMSENMNNPASEKAMVAALQYVATHYPPGGPMSEPKTSAEAGQLQAEYPMAVELPKGMRKSFYERIAKEVGPQTEPYTQQVQEEAKLPVYHVTRVWMRFHEGTIDILRPMPEMGNGPDGKPVYQKVTVRLTGGFEPWRVVHARSWGPGVDSPPEPYFVPTIERTNQFEYSYMTPEQQEKADRTTKAEVITDPAVRFPAKPAAKPETAPAEAAANESVDPH